MLAYIKGNLEAKMTEYVVIDVGGLGYKIYMSESSIEKLGKIGDLVKIHTDYRVREDDISIFGFNTQEELKMFELLLGVSGVGARTALAMLATCTPSEFALAVVSEDVKVLTEIPGIGPKSAKRIITIWGLMDSGWIILNRITAYMILKITVTATVLRWRSAISIPRCTAGSSTTR